MAKDELLVIDRTYELLKWFLGRLSKFPRAHRYGLGQQIGTLYPQIAQIAQMRRESHE